MPKIPLAEVPNAPGSTMMPLGNNLGGVNLMGAAAMVQRQTIAPGSFDGPAAGAAALGRSVQNLGAQLGGALTQIAVHKQKADDDTKILTAQAKLSEAWMGYQSTLAPGSDTSEWVPGWQKTLPQVTKEILADKTLSPAAKQAIQEHAIRFGAQTTGPLGLSAAKESFERSKSAHLTLAKRQIETGDIAGAKATYDVLGEKQLLEPEAIDGLKQSADRQGELNAAMKLIETDPIGAAEDLADESKFPTLATSQRQALQVDAERAKVGRERTSFEFIGEAIKTGRIGTMEDAIEAAGGKDYLTPTTLMKIEQMLKREAPVSYEAVSALQGRADAIDPLKDKTGRERFELERDAYELPEPFRAQVMKTIGDKYDGKPGSVTMTEVREKMDAALANQLLGTFDEKKVKAGDLEETKKKEAAYQLKLKIENEVEEWSRKNPNANDVQRNEFLNSRFRANALMQEPEDNSHWDWFAKPKPPVGAPAAIDTKRQIDEALKKYRPQKTSDAATGTLPDSLISSVKSMEGFTAKASWDYKQHSVGYGTRAKAAGEVLTEKEADARLREELAQHAARIDEAAQGRGFKLTQGQRNALISFDFNTGAGAEVVTTSESLDDIKRRLALYTKVTEGGKKVESKGLANRRAKELALFNS